MDRPLTRRRFLRKSATALGAAIVGHAAIAESPRGPSQSRLQRASDGAENPIAAKLVIAATEPVRVMRGGIGASFHAIDATLPGMTPSGGSWSGSAWGGNPGPDDDRRWEELFKHADWLGMDWCRVELEQRMYEPERRIFDWDNREMRVLYRILDWAESRGVEVFLQQMWSNVAWNAYPGNAIDPIRRLRSAPYSIQEWAYGLGELLEHLVRVKAYSCISWVSVSNEPGHDDFSWWQDSDMKSAPFTPGLEAARREFDRRGLTVRLSAPDRTDLPEFKPEDVDFDSCIGAYDLHSYNCVFDSMRGGYTLSQAEQRMTDWAQWAHSKNKPFFLSEFGTMAYGWGHEDAGPSSYQSGLKNASLVVRGINAGVDGFNRWSFTNRGNLDGQWQLVRTWDVDRDRLLDCFVPQPNAYYQFAMLSRYLPRHSGVLASRVEAPFLEPDRKLVAAALASCKDNITILLVNESYRPVDLKMELQGLRAPLRLLRYSLTKEIEDKGQVDLVSDRSFAVSKELSDRVSPTSIVVYSTYSLGSDDPGLIANLR
ncbi:MAG: hypothetical protein ABSA42_22355 [Terracidiphilus sp.]